MLPTDITLEESLELIGFRPGDRIAICHSAPDVEDDWNELVIDVADMPAENARRFCEQVNTWHSVNVPGAPIGSRQRGAESTVARVNALFSDLDFKTELKPGGINDLATAEQIINEVSARVGHKPTVVVSSGHGLQPYWPMEPDDADELPIGDGMALSRAFGALVAIVANEIQPGVTVDNVADLSRVGRSAGGINYKEPHHPVPTFATAWGGAPIGVQELKDRLEDIGIDWKDYRNPPTGEVISPPEHWVWNECAHCTYTPVMITGWQKDKPGQRHQWMLSQKVRIEAARRHGCFPDQESYLAAHAALDKRFAELRTPRRYECASAQRWAMDRVSRKADGELLRELGDHIHHDEMIGGGEPKVDNTIQAQEAEPTTREQAHAVFTKWFGKDYDTDALDAELATLAVERFTDGSDPIWLLLISGSGNAKTEAVQATAGAGAIITSSISSDAALLSGTAKRERTKTSNGGLLRLVGKTGVLAIKDVTSILSMNRDLRAKVLAALREVYDGRWTRDVGTEGGLRIEWVGRIAVVGAVTTAWDTAHGVVSAMGDRFVLVRMDSTEGRQAAGRKAIGNTGSEPQMRQELAAAVAGVIAGMNTDPITPTDDEIETLLDAADLVTLARTAVEFDYRGDVIDAHAPEMPTRFAKQLAQIVRGGVAVGMERADALRLAIRCARDSMPPMRLAIIEDLAKFPASSSSDVRKRIGKPRTTVDRQLQALNMLGIADVEEVGPEGKSRWFYTINPKVNPVVLQTL